MMGAPSAQKKIKAKNQKANLFAKDGRWGVRIKLPACYEQHEYKRLIGTKAEAEEDRERVRRLIRLRQPLDPEPLASCYLADFIEEARRAWNPRDPRYRYSKVWIEWGGHKLITDITRPAVMEALRELRETYAASTVRMLHTTLRAAFILAVERGVLRLERSPFFRPYKLERANERNTPLPAEKVVELLQVVGPKRRNFVLFAILSGLRAEELLGLRWDDVDFSRGQLIIHRPKQRRPHREPLSEWMREVLLEQKELGSEYCFPSSRGTRYAKGSWAGTWTRWYKKIGIYGVHTWHDMRHTCATLAASNGESLVAIGRVLGQGNPCTTQRYAHVLETAAKGTLETVSSALRDAIEGVEKD